MTREGDALLAFCFMLLAIFLAGVHPAIAPGVLLGIGIAYLLTVGILDRVIKRSAKRRNHAKSPIIS